MLLYEYEGKQLLSKYGVAIPRSKLLTSIDQTVELPHPLVAKAQVLSGKRKAAGGIIFLDTKTVTKQIEDLFNSIVNEEKVNSILLEEQMEFSKEYFLSLTYDTFFRSPVIAFSEVGGTDIENRETITFPIDVYTHEADYPSTLELSQSLKEIIKKLIAAFFAEDAILLEINPLVETIDGLVALDAKINLDDNAFFRHTDRKYPPRSIPGYTPTTREIDAKKIDADDYRGTAGTAYFDLPGDIAVLASGGGASLTAMDALISIGGKPANYTEYSGNPSREKVKKLTEIVLSKSGLHGLWVVGAIANFTDIFETLSGLIEAVKTITPKPQFPIVIRRGGPRDDEAFDMLRHISDLDLHVYGPETSISQSAKIMFDLAKKYADTIK